METVFRIGFKVVEKKSTVLCTDYIYKFYLYKMKNNILDL